MKTTFRSCFLIALFSISPGFARSSIHPPIQAALQKLVHLIPPENEHELHNWIRDREYWEPLGIIVQTNHISINSEYARMLQEELPTWICLEAEFRGITPAACLKELSLDPLLLHLQVASGAIKSGKIGGFSCQSGKDDAGNVISYIEVPGRVSIQDSERGLIPIEQFATEPVRQRLRLMMNMVRAEEIIHALDRANIFYTGLTLSSTINQILHNHPELAGSDLRELTAFFTFKESLPDLFMRYPLDQLLIQKHPEDRDTNMNKAAKLARERFLFCNMIFTEAERIK